MQFCQNCGCDLEQFTPVSFGNIMIDEFGAIMFEGKPVSLKRGQHEIVQSLVRAKGRRLSRGLLASRLDRDIEDRTIIKYIERSRMAFRSVDPTFDQIEAQHGFGTYSWTYRRAA